ncbi:guanitoxin biosynthesis pre-guanitoxin forming N-methyltransferase GntF [Nocardia alni]|uniref:guanitoxin biosynthesis pre-guanitoxin forming N-methyltransferase GntF n=1 Tax=Nocardia alni TaxID=2815723 RepID=UPI001C238206|nr:guanitoxin biosynthesis pre-guanitoxin forming N-methyltransferase GntF [Nocardia alni]
MRSYYSFPRDYLAQFYEGDVDPGNQALLRFYATVYLDLAGRSLLEFGGGPTIYSIITAARTAGWIHFCDYNSACLHEVDLWWRNGDDAFDWSRFIDYALQCEKDGAGSGAAGDVLQRAGLLRRRIRQISYCDILADDPLLGCSLGPYGVVANTFCLDSMIEDKAQWEGLNRKLAGLVDRKGLYVTVSLLNASHWTAGGVRYPAVTLTPGDVLDLYADLGFHVTYSEVVENLEGKIGYDGFIMVCGQR